MDYIIAIIFGAVQGLTEFIPVSSSGHLVILHTFFPSFGTADEVAFDVSLHVGTLFALLIFFWKDIFLYAKAWFTSLPLLFRKETRHSVTTDQRLSWSIFLAIIPAGVVGFFFENWIEAIFRSPLVVITMLIVVAFLFLYIERFGTDYFQRDIEEIRWKDALFVGSMQVLALVPGTSRSGITISAGMITRLKRETAARFSFLVSLPLIAAAGLKKGIDLVIVGIGPGELPMLIIGVVSSALIGYIAIASLLRFLSKHTLKVFAWYRIALAIFVFFFLYFTNGL